MSKLGQYLQQHISGEVSSSPDARRAHATDASIFTLTPSLIVYPRTEQDVRKTARFACQLAERGRPVPITARGAGSDLSGAALGSGIMLAFTAHMNRVLEFDNKTGLVIAEPGLNFGALQQTLFTHGRCLPSYPASFAYSTIGGAVANNASGAKSVKYGPIGRSVKGLRVVLANGESIITGRLHKAELNKKLGLSTFEGEIYRGLDGLLDEYQEALATPGRRVAQDVAGYDLRSIRRKDGSFDLTPLFVGSQGTLGIVTEVMLQTEPYNPETTLLLAAFDTAAQLQAAVTELMAASERPSALEMLGKHLLEAAAATHSLALKQVLAAPYPAFVLLVEYDDARRAQHRAAHRARKILGKHAANVTVVTDADDQDALWAVHDLAALPTAGTDGALPGVPLMEDGAVPLEQLEALITGLEALLTRYHLRPALWGRVGAGMVRTLPQLDLGAVGDRQKLFKLMDEYARLVLELGGTLSAAHGDGRLRGLQLEQSAGAEAYGLWQKVKSIFDPHNILNPGVKVNVALDDIKPLIRSEYALGYLQHYLPRM